MGRPTGTFGKSSPRGKSFGDGGSLSKPTQKKPKTSTKKK